MIYEVSYPEFGGVGERFHSLVGAYRIMSCQIARNDGFGMPYHGSRLFAGTEEIAHLSLCLESGGAGGKMEITHGITLGASGGAVGFRAMLLLNSRLRREAPARGEAVAAENAHGAAVTMFHAIGGGSGGSRGIHENISFYNIPISKSDRRNASIFFGESRGGGLEPKIHAEVFEVAENGGFHFVDIVERCMSVSRELYVFVTGARVQEREHLSSHGKKFFRCGETTVVAENASYQSRAQKHVCPFQQSYISSATAGRLLGELEEQNYLLQVSNKGRILSEQGRAFLEDLEEQEHLQDLAFQLLQEIRRGDAEEMVGGLVARRAIERETCRLAAVHATEREAEEILAFAEILEQGESFPERHAAVMDHKFHEAIAMASRNAVLLAALRLIHRGPSFWRPLANVRHDERYSIRGDHLSIAQGILNRDPEKAEKALLDHLEKVIEAAKNMMHEEI